MKLSWRQGLLDSRENLLTKEPRKIERILER